MPGDSLYEMPLPHLAPNMRSCLRVLVVNTSNSYDLPSPQRGKSIPVHAIVTNAFDASVDSKLSAFAKSFEPNIQVPSASNPGGTLSFYDNRISDLQGEFKPFSYEDLIITQQEGPYFTFGKLVPTSY